MYNPREEFERIKKSNDLWLLCTDVAKIINLSPQGIRNQARDDPAKLGFPVVVVGKKVKIPRLPFISFVETGLLKQSEDAASDIYA